MWSLVALAVGLGLASLTCADQLRVATRIPPAFTTATPDQVVSNYAAVQKTSSITSSSRHLKIMQRDEYTNGSYSHGTAPLQLATGGGIYTIPIKLGSTVFQVYVDTGSSDTWLATNGFDCVDAKQATLPDYKCGLGPLFDGTVDGNRIQNENFNTSYGDGSFAIGVLSYENITIAGIDVKHQEIALVHKANWHGRGDASGLLGLGYAAWTSAYAGTDPSRDDRRTTRIEYSPIFQTMYTQGLCAPMFSLALERGSGGYIAFGGLPPVQFDPVFARTPIRIVESYLSDSDIAQFSTYAIIADGFVYEGSEESQMVQESWSNTDSGLLAIVDSGSTNISLPPNMATAINALFEPPAVFSGVGGIYLVQCNATAPEFGVTISGYTFYINPIDLIFHGSSENDANLCISRIMSGSPDVCILGDAFLTNVVAVFDVGAAEMRFAPHEY